MCGSSCGGCGSCVCCKIVGMLSSLVLLLVVVAAALGVWSAHHTVDGMWIFGTQLGSISLVTLVIAVAAFWKVLKKSCPCRSKACGSGCCTGGACGCGDKGECSMCHSSPCKCK